MGKIKDKDKAGITTGTTMIEPMGHKQNHPKEMDSKGKNQKPAAGGSKAVSRGQKIRC